MDFNLQHYDSLFENKLNTDEPDTLLNMRALDAAHTMDSKNSGEESMHKGNNFVMTLNPNPLCATINPLLEFNASLTPLDLHDYTDVGMISRDLHDLVSTVNKMSTNTAKQVLSMRNMLLKYQILVNNKFAVVMIDCGATMDFISLDVARSLKLNIENTGAKINVKLADGSYLASTSVVNNVCLQLGDHIEFRTLRVLPMNNIQVILGKPWLYDLNPSIDWKTHTMEFVTNGLRHVIHPTTCLSIAESVNIMHHYQFNANDIRMLAFIQHKDNANNRNSNRDHIISLPLDDGHVAVICNLDSVTEMKDKENPSDYVEKEFRKFFKPGTAETQDFPEDCYEDLVQFFKSNPSLATPMDPGKPPTRIIGNAPPVEMDIQELPGSVPQCKQPYRMSPLELQELKKQLDHLLKAGYIRPSKSPYGAPVLFAPKKNGALRLCLDYRALNAQTIKDRYPIPRDSDCFDQYKGAKYFSTMDALNGYWVTPISERSIHKTAIRTPLGSFEWLVMPFGLTNAPSTYQRMMESILSDYLTKFVMVFIDDVCVYTKGDAHLHLKHVKLVLEALNKYQIKVKLEKCKFFMTEVEYLGHIVSGTELKPDPKKITTITEWPEPETAHQIQQFIGLVGYYQKMIKDFAKIAAPLTDVMSLQWQKDEKDKYFKEPQRRAFASLKLAMTTAPVLTLPDMTKPFIVQTDASLRALGAALMQQHDKGRKVVAFLSKKFTPTETRWPTHERELFAFVHAFKKWRHYLHGSSVSLEGDHKPLTWIKTQKTLSGKQARWLQTLEEIDYTVNYVPGKELVVPDAISRRPDLMENPEKLSFLAYLMIMHHDQLESDLKAQPYLWHALQEIALETITHASPHEDVSHAVSVLAMGEDILDSNANAHDVNDVPDISLSIPHDNAYETSKGSITMQKIFSASINAYIDDPFAQRIMQGENIPNYFQQNGLIYFKDPQLEFPVLYLPSHATELHQEIIHENHDVPLTGHLSTEKTLEKVQRFFHWPGMKNTIDAYVKSCTACQQSKRRTVKSSGTNIPYPIADHPWEIVALDMKTGLPKTSRGHDAAWVFVDRLTRRGHVVPCSKNITAPELARLFFEQVIRLHGVPRVIISDRDPRFTSMFWKELWKIVGTRLNVSTADHAATDGGSERYIGTLMSMLRAYCHDNPYDWDLYLPAMEFAYNDSVHPATGYTPFQLDNGRDPSTPMQFLMHGVITRPALYKQYDSGLLDPSAYLQKFTTHIHKARQQLRQHQLSQWKRLQQRATLPILYEPGEYVWIQAYDNRDKDKIGSLMPRYEGPYRVIRRVSPNTYQLDFGKDHPRRHHTVNEEKLKPYLNRDTGLPYPSSSQSQVHVDGEPIASPTDLEHTELNEENHNPSGDNHSYDTDLPPNETAKERQGVVIYNPCDRCRKANQGLPYCLARGHQPTIHSGPKPISRRTGLPPIKIITHRIRDEKDNDGDVVKHAELLVKSLGQETWKLLHDLIVDGYWKICKPYIMELQSQRLCPLFQLVTSKYRKNPIDGVCTSYEETEPDDKPYRITHADGGFEDVSNQYFEQLKNQYGSLDYLCAIQQHIRRPIRILDLYSGTKSVSKAIRSLFPNAIVVTVDIDKQFGPTHNEDIVQWDPTEVYRKHHFDIIWASPPCTEYSYSKTHGNRDLHSADQRVLAALRIINALQPHLWIIENPVGYLAKRPIMQPYENLKHTTTYCCYGMPYRKATNIWTNAPVVLKSCFDMPCPYKAMTNRHAQTAQRGPHTFVDGTIAKGAKTQQVLYAVPPQLIRHIITSSFTRIPTC